MKKGWKIFWIICAVLAAVGLLLAAAGTALGGIAMLNSNLDERVFNAWITRVTGRNTNTAENNHDEGYVPAEPDGDMIASYEAVSEISLELGGAGVCMLPYDGEDILVDLTQIRSELQDLVHVSQEEGELKVELKKGDWWDINDGGMLYISIPVGTFYDSVSAEVGAGYLEMRELKAEALSLEAGAGQIIAEDITADQASAYCGAGQIILSGNVAQKADLECAVGEILFTAAGAFEAYDYELSCSLGEIVLGDRAYSGLANQVSIDNRSGRTVSADCDMGRIEIIFEQE